MTNHFVISILFIAVCFTPTFIFGNTKSITQIQQELESNNQIIKQKKIEERSLLKDLGNLRKTIYITQKKLNKAYRSYSHYANKIKEKEKKLKEEKEVIDNTKKFLNHKILTFHKEKNRPIIELIFNSESFSELINNLYLYEKVIEHDIKSIANAKEKITLYKQEKKALEKYKYKARILKKQILRERYALKKTKKSYQSNLTSLRSELKKFEKRNKVIQEESKQLSKIIKQSYKKTKKTYFGTSHYIRPTGGYISSRFGLRRHPIFKRRRMHYGIDFAAPRGYRIKSADSGYVLFSGYKRGYGNVTIINHGWKNGNRISSLYAHQWKRLVRKGQRIKKGQLIGYVGSSGYSTGPHLHFEIRENGTPVNPTRYLRI